MADRLKGRAMAGMATAKAGRLPRRSTLSAWLGGNEAAQADYAHRRLQEAFAEPLYASPNAARFGQDDANATYGTQPHGGDERIGGLLRDFDFGQPSVTPKQSRLSRYLSEGDRSHGTAEKDAGADKKARIAQALAKARQRSADVYRRIREARATEDAGDRLKPWTPSIQQRLSGMIQTGLEEAGMSRYSARHDSEALIGIGETLSDIGGAAAAAEDFSRAAGEGSWNDVGLTGLALAASLLPFGRMGRQIAREGRAGARVAGEAGHLEPNRLTTGTKNAPDRKGAAAAMPEDYEPAAEKGDRFARRQMGYGTHEATPGKETRDLPAVSKGMQEVREAHASDRRAWWADADTGRDAWHTALGLDAHPTVSTTGIYQGEFNPGMAARSMVAPTGPRGRKVLAEGSVDRARFNAAEAGRALFGGQEAGGWSVPIENPRLDHANAYALKLPADMQGRKGLKRVIAAAKASVQGMPDVVHLGGENALMTRFDPPPPPITPRGRRETAAKMGERGIEAVPVRLESGYIPYTQAEGFGGPNNLRPGWELPEGTDTVTQSFLSRLTPHMERALDASPVLRQSILDKFNYGIEQAARLRSPVREDLQNVRRVFAEGWPEMGLPRGIAGIKLGLGRGLFPAVAVMPLLPYLTDAQDQASGGGGL
jgi:hypothetical protein